MVEKWKQGSRVPLAREHQLPVDGDELLRARSTFRHAGQCEHRYTSDPAPLRAILKVRDGAGGGYWWVECGTCECGWQVPHYPVA